MQSHIDLIDLFDANDNRQASKMRAQKLPADVCSFENIIVVRKFKQRKSSFWTVFFALEWWRTGFCRLSVFVIVASQMGRLFTYVSLS